MMPRSAVLLMLVLWLPCARTLNVAVVGGGIGGSLTVLELLTRKGVNITLFEQGGEIGHSKSASGIIAAMLNFNSYGSHSANKVVDDIQQGHLSPRLLAFAANYLNNSAGKDARTSLSYQGKFLRQSRTRLEEQLDRWPELCEAVVGPFCCREGSPARLWMERVGADRTGWSCNKTYGLATVWMNSTGNGTAAQKQIVQEYLKEKRVAGVQVDHSEGFVRTELLYPILTSIFKGSGRVDLVLNCSVDAVVPAPAGRLQVHTSASQGIFDRVIVSGGANSIAMMKQDTMLPAQMIPVKGYSVGTKQPLIRRDDLGLAVHVVETGSWIRPQANGGVRAGFGLTIGTFDDELLTPRFTPSQKDMLSITQVGLGRATLRSDDVERRAGIRPLSVFGDFPLLKRYRGDFAGLVLNTGFGFKGFTLSPKSAQLAVDLAIHGSVPTEWVQAVDLPTIAFNLV